MGTDDTTGEDKVDDELTDELEAEDAEVTGNAMGLPGPLDGLPTGLPGSNESVHGRKAGERPLEYLKVTIQDTQISG